MVLLLLALLQVGLLVVAGAELEFDPVPAITGILPFETFTDLSINC